MYYVQNPSRSLTTPSPIYRQQQNILKVSGENTLSVQPDTAIITLGTITESKDVSTAQSENSKVISNAINSLTQMGILNEDIKTVDYRIDMEYDYENGKQILRGYKVTHLLQVTIDQINQTGQIIDSAVSSGVNTVSSVQFTLSQPETFYNHALSQALKNAQQKAETIANSLGLTLNKVPIKATEVSVAVPPIPYHLGLYAKSEVTPIQHGQMQIRAAIDAEFVYFS